MFQQMWTNSFLSNMVTGLYLSRQYGILAITFSVIVIGLKLYSWTIYQIISIINGSYLDVNLILSDLSNNVLVQALPFLKMCN